MELRITMDTGLFLDDFEAEARTHIENIESAFLDAGALAGDPKLMNSVFRAAHSLKGTAGFFSLKKIVAVAHELESVFSQIKDGNLMLDEEIVDVALASIDCLKALVDNLHADDIVDTKSVLQTLKAYSSTQPAEDEAVEAFHMPFDISRRDLKDALKNAVRHGHVIYYVNIGFNRSLGKFFKRPAGLLESFLSIGSIMEAIVDGKADEIISDADTAAMTAKIIAALSKHDTTTLDLLVTSVLEPELYAIALEVDKKHIHPLPRESFFRTEAGGRPKKKLAQGVGKGGAHRAEGDPERGVKQQQPVRENNFSIRLDVSAINHLLDLANEMILSRNQLLSTVSDYKKSIAGITPILHDISRLTSEIQEKVMRTRMQPINMIFSKFPRIIHDTAKALNKDIKMEVFGADVMLDKYLLESLTDPITQLVRNSADHGVEPADRRAALGKPRTGMITLNAYMRDGFAIIEVMDDGGGIDAEALKRKGLELELITEEAAAAMSRNDFVALVFEPGISTAKRITNISGRGFGMDIVKTNIEKLGGSIEIESEVDKGTTTRLKMPLTLSVTRTLIVTINGIQYAVPEINIERIVRIWRGRSSRRLERINNSLVLSLRGRIIPLVTMDEIDAKARGIEPPSAESQLEKYLRRDVTKCLVLKAGDKNFALLIDDAVETEETLVKSLPIYLQSCLCFSNVTVLGNGNAITILDAEGIMRFMGIEAVEKSAPAEEVKKDARDEKQVIIFTCSGTEYFALETSEISRIEIIVPKDIQEIGDSAFINIAGETIRVVRPEDYAPVKKHDYAEERLYMLTLKKSETPLGLLVGRVLDKIEDAFVLDTDHLRSDFVYGTSVFGERILVFLNSTAIVEEVEKEKRIKRKRKPGKKAV